MHASSASRARVLVRSVALCLLAAAAAVGAAGCTHAGGRPPVDSPIYAFQPVDPDEYADDTEDSDDDGGDDEATEE